ncbi:family with sequence similarity 47 member E [Phyllostomus discolor]|uniref:Family with sequence similarity 47 member E n=1 Tax=Phyllostomus discolor TaxID=89673 RepID=A0A834EQT7_9CHIR|nr:family with sequence similarity 47 member E [Phyllostomus discolor]
MDSLHEDGSPLCENARRAVNDFCQWTGDITSVKIDEEFVMKQFHLDCQSKPSCYGLSMMRLDQLPLELKKSIRLNKWQEAEFFKERERKLEEELLSFAKLYGPAAFKEFILRKGYRMPSVSKGSFQKDLLSGSRLFMERRQYPAQSKTLLFFFFLKILFIYF